MNKYFDRLKIIWESMGYGDATKFAREIGYSRGENILRLKRNDNNEPGMMVLEDIVRKFPDFDFYFLLTGEKKEKRYKQIDDPPGFVAAGVELYSCPDCRPKVHRITELEKEIADLKEELLQVYREQAKKESNVKDSPQYRQAANQ